MTVRVLGWFARRLIAALASLVVDVTTATTADDENPQVTPVEDEPGGKPLWRGWEA